MQCVCLQVTPSVESDYVAAWPVVCIALRSRLHMRAPGSLYELPTPVRAPGCLSELPAPVRASGRRPRAGRRSLTAGGAGEEGGGRGDRDAGHRPRPPHAQEAARQVLLTRTARC